MLQGVKREPMKPKMEVKMEPKRKKTEVGACSGARFPRRETSHINIVMINIVIVRVNDDAHDYCYIIIVSLLGVI